jgi:hypothetical protein
MAQQVRMHVSCLETCRRRRAHSRSSTDAIDSPCICPPYWLIRKWSVSRCCAITMRCPSSPGKRVCAILAPGTAGAAARNWRARPPSGLRIERATGGSDTDMQLRVYALKTVDVGVLDDAQLAATHSAVGQQRQYGLVVRREEGVAGRIGQTPARSSGSIRSNSARSASGVWTSSQRPRSVQPCFRIHRFSELPDGLDAVYLTESLETPSTTSYPGAVPDALSAAFSDELRDRSRWSVRLAKTISSRSSSR